MKKIFSRVAEDIATIIKLDPAARNRLEVMINYPGFHAMIFYRLAHWCWQKRLFFLARLISTIGRWLTAIDIHPGAAIGRRLFIDHGLGTVIGETAVIGDDCILYHNVTLGAINPALCKKGEKRHPTLESKVVVGAGAKILGAITIGQGAFIGANAVVTKNVCTNTKMLGNPAREFKVCDELEC